MNVPTSSHTNGVNAICWVSLLARCALERSPKRLVGAVPSHLATQSRRRSISGDPASAQFQALGNAAQFWESVRRCLRSPAYRWNVSGPWCSTATRPWCSRFFAAAQPVLAGRGACRCWSTLSGSVAVARRRHAAGTDIPRFGQARPERPVKLATWAGDMPTGDRCTAPRPPSDCSFSTPFQVCVLARSAESSGMIAAPIRRSSCEQNALMWRLCARAQP